MYPVPHCPATFGLHDIEHQFLPAPSVRHCPVEQSWPAVQNLHMSGAPICGRHALPFVEAWQENPAGQGSVRLVQSFVQMRVDDPVGPSQTSGLVQPEPVQTEPCAPLPGG